MGVLSRRKIDSCRQKEDFTLPPPRSKVLLQVICLLSPSACLTIRRKKLCLNNLYLLKVKRLRVSAKDLKL